jgi:hypothetical protein
MASVRERKGKNGKLSYTVYIRKKGFAAITKTFSTKEKAELFASQTESSFENSNLGGFIIPKLPLKLWIERAIIEILPTSNYPNHQRSYMNFWKENLGDKIASEITNSEIEFVADSLYQRTTKYGTPMTTESRRKYLMALSSLYGTAIKKWKWATYNPVTACDMHHQANNRGKNLVIDDESFKSFREKLNTKIQESMKKLAFTQRSLARETGMALQTVQYTLDKTKNPTLKNLIKVMEKLNIKLEVYEK